MQLNTVNEHTEYLLWNTVMTLNIRAETYMSEQKRVDSDQTAPNVFPSDLHFNLYIAWQNRSAE